MTGLLVEVGNTVVWLESLEERMAAMFCLEKSDLLWMMEMRKEHLMKYKTCVQVEQSS